MALLLGLISEIKSWTYLVFRLYPTDLKPFWAKMAAEFFLAEEKTHTIA